MPDWYPLKTTILVLCQKLNLPYLDPFEQDWQHMVVDPYRINDFLTLYKSDPSLTDNEKQTLGMILIGSFNEALEMGVFAEELWHTTVKMLQLDSILHGQTLHYWACWDEKDSTNWFPISQKVRATIVCFL